MKNMKKKNFLAIFTLIFGLTLGSSLTKSFVKLINDEKEQANKIEDLKEKNAASTSTMTLRVMTDYLQTKKEHYPLSDEFIERYQQTSGGYLDYAKQLGLVVSKELHEPNQKWHFFDSWLYRTVDESTKITYESSAKSSVYTGLKCPELLLWIFEACEVEPSKVKAAKEAAEAGKVAGLNVATLAKNMRNCVPWEDIEANILNNK